MILHPFVLFDKPAAGDSSFWFEMKRNELMFMSLAYVEPTRSLSKVKAHMNPKVQSICVFCIEILYCNILQLLDCNLQLRSGLELLKFKTNFAPISDTEKN